MPLDGHAKSRLAVMECLLSIRRGRAPSSCSGRSSMGATHPRKKRERRHALTVGQLADLYLREGSVEKPNKKLSSWETDRSNIDRHVRPLLGARLARGLTKMDVARFQFDVAAGKTAKDEKTGPRGRAIVRGGKGIASRALSVLSAMMTFGEGRGIIASNPTKGVEPFRGRKKERFLTDTEVGIWRGTCRDGR